MLKFDPITLAEWKTRHIDTISIEFVSSGCEGTSILIHEGIILPGYTQIDYDSCSVYSLSSYVSVLQDAYITRTGKKWIMKSEKVLTRCGCGRSFGIATGDSKVDKIRLLKSKLSGSKGIHH